MYTRLQNTITIIVLGFAVQIGVSFHFGDSNMAAFYVMVPDFFIFHLLSVINTIQYKYKK